MLLVLFTFCFNTMHGQEAAAVDSLKKALAEAKTVDEKVVFLDELSRAMMNVNPKESDEYGRLLITIAEESRNRNLMFRAYLSNGLRCSYFATRKEYSDKSIEFYNKAYELARQNRMEKEAGIAQMQLAGLYLLIPDKEKALSNITQAFSLLNTLEDDSLIAEAHNMYGMVYMARNENILAIRNFLSALHIAEGMKDPGLLQSCYSKLSGFYSSIEDYDKAIDYMVKSYEQFDGIRLKNTPYNKVVYINAIGNLYAYKKNYDIAISYFERSIRMADSLKFSSLKVPGYVSLLNQYLRIDEPQKALDYLNSPAGNNLKQYLKNFGMSGMIDQAYGVVYSQIGQYDSARIYLERAKPMFENSTNESTRVTFYAQLASFYKKSGDKEKAIEYLLKVKEISEKNGMLENIRRACKNLDTLYKETGNLVLAGNYNALYYKYKDSIETLKREKELTQVEAADEQQRMVKLAKEKEEANKRRNNIQYMAITIGIVALFVALVVLGMFKVSTGLIKAIGFFVFLLLFEFIFLVFKKNIYSITKGEPWKDLAFMIGLAAILVPLHHWLEHEVLKYLTSHNRLTSAGSQLKSKILSRIKREVK